MKRELLSGIIIGYRRANGLNQKDFAKKCDLSVSEISKLEYGISDHNFEIIEPDMKTFKKLARGMGITRAELIARIDGTYKPEKEEIKSFAAYNVPIIESKSDICCKDDDAKQLEQIKVSGDLYKRDDTLAFRIADDGLCPVMQKDDIAIIWQNEQYSNGDYVLVSSVTDNSLKCYRYYKFDYTTVLFGNLSVDPIIQDASTLIIGKVVFVQKSIL